MIDYDALNIKNGIEYLKWGIKGALESIDNGKINKVELGPNISLGLIYECSKELGWPECDDMDSNGWEHDYWYYVKSPSGKKVVIEGSLWCGLDTTIRLAEENENDYYKE